MKFEKKLKIRWYRIATMAGIFALALLIIFFTKTSPDAEIEPGAVQALQTETSSPEATTSDDVAVTNIVKENEEPKSTQEPVVELLYEAEDATLIDLMRYTEANENGVKAKSGDGYVGTWNSDDCELIFNVDVPKSGMYELSFLTAACYGESYNAVVVNDITYDNQLYTEQKEFEISAINAKLNEGANIITVKTGWGLIFIDCMYVKSIQGISSDVYNVKNTLINENASDNTRRLMSYLVDQYGKFTLSGQYHYSNGIHSPEIQEIYKLTGKYPAIMGFDFMDYSPSRVEYGAETEQTKYAVEWHDLGGIVTCIWHWNAPKDLINSKELPWWKGFYTQATTFDLNKALNGQDPEGYELMLRDIDAIAEQLKILADKDIPVLWRPLHEASGGYFWWGAYGAENYKKLWKLMYERMTDTNQLNNLIWVYNAEDADWYPGDEYVDIISEDVYTEPHNYESQFNRFIQASQYSSENKIIALSENGVIPDPDLMYEYNACWSFFVIWNECFIIDKKSKEISDEYNELEHFIKVFNHTRVITLDELPKLDQYPIDGL